MQKAPFRQKLAREPKQEARGLKPAVVDFHAKDAGAANEIAGPVLVSDGSNIFLRHNLIFSFDARPAGPTHIE